MKKAIITISCILFIATQSFSQDSVSTGVLEKKDINELVSFMHDKLKEKPYNDTLASMCISSVSFIKFNLSDKGRIENIKFDKYSPATINEIVLKVMHDSSIQWNPTISKGRSIKDKTIILPFVYVYETSCVTPSWSKQIRFTTPLFNMLDFKDETFYNGIDCFLLWPLVMGAID